MIHTPAARFCLTGATVVDGTGGPAFSADIVVENGQILDIGAGLAEREETLVDCGGKWLAPGFIDAHSHMDYYAATQRAEFFQSFTRQGITSFIGGNCGFSPCAAVKGGPHTELLDNTLFEVPPEKSVVEDDLRNYEKGLKHSDIEQRFYSLVGHGSYRTSISGHEARELTGQEEALLFEKLEEALQKGAIGISLGLQYKPGVFVSRAEILKVARLCKQYDRVLAVHARAFSKVSGTYPIRPFAKPHNLMAIEDMINVAEETGVRLQFSHLIFVGRKTWPSFDKALALIEQARARGVDICFDMFPYSCGATLLNTMFPEWFMAAMPGAAKSKFSRLRLRLELEVGFRAVGFDYRDILVSHTGSDFYQGLEGHTVAEIAAAKQQTQFYTLIDLLEKSNSKARVLFNAYYGPGHIEQLMANPAVLFSTDAWPELNGIQNPAAFGSFPKFLQLARSHQLSIEGCIRKMTGATADRFGLNNIGYLKKGAQADMVMFDPQAVKDNTSSDNHSAAPSGIEAVYIAGERLAS